MKATIDGIVVEGTVEELTEYVFRIRGTANSVPRPTQYIPATNKPKKTRKTRYSLKSVRKSMWKYRVDDAIEFLEKNEKAIHLTYLMRQTGMSSRQKVKQDFIRAIEKYSKGRIRLHASGILGNRILAILDSPDPIPTKVTAVAAKPVVKKEDPKKIFLTKREGYYMKQCSLNPAAAIRAAEADWAMNKPKYIPRPAQPALPLPRGIGDHQKEFFESFLRDMLKRGDELAWSTLGKSLFMTATEWSDFCESFLIHSSRISEYLGVKDNFILRKGMGKGALVITYLQRKENHGQETQRPSY